MKETNPRKTFEKAVVGSARMSIVLESDFTPVQLRLPVDVPARIFLNPDLGERVIFYLKTQFEEGLRHYAEQMPDREEDFAKTIDEAFLRNTVINPDRFEEEFGK